MSLGDGPFCKTKAQSRHWDHDPNSVSGGQRAAGRAVLEPSTDVGLTGGLNFRWKQTGRCLHRVQQGPKQREGPEKAS